MKGKVVISYTQSLYHCRDIATCLASSSFRRRCSCSINSFANRYLPSSLHLCWYSCSKRRKWYFCDVTSSSWPCLHSFDSANSLTVWSKMDRNDDDWQVSMARFIINLSSCVLPISSMIARHISDVEASSSAFLWYLYKEWSALSCVADGWTCNFCSSCAAYREKRCD